MIINAKPNSYFKYALAIDCETTGMVFDNKTPVVSDDGSERHQAISWGACVINTDTLEIVDEKYIEVKWNENSLAQRNQDSEFGRYAEKNIHGLTLDHLNANGVDEEDAIVSIVNMIVDYWEDRPFVTLGYGVHSFDNLFLRDALDRYDAPIKISNRCIDTASVGVALFQAYDSPTLFKMISNDDRWKNNALSNAKASINVIKAARMIVDLVD